MSPVLLLTHSSNPQLLSMTVQNIPETLFHFLGPFSQVQEIWIMKALFKEIDLPVPTCVSVLSWNTLMCWFNEKMAFSHLGKFLMSYSCMLIKIDCSSNKSKEQFFFFTFLKCDSLFAINFSFVGPCFLCVWVFFFFFCSFNFLYEPCVIPAIEITSGRAAVCTYTTS